MTDPAGGRRGLQRSGRPTHGDDPPVTEAAGSSGIARAHRGAAAHSKAARGGPHRPASPATRLRRRLRFLYEGNARPAIRFRYGVLAFDLLTVAYVVGTSFVRHTPVIELLDVLFGLAIVADLAARLFIARRPARELLHPAFWADVAAVISFLAPLVGEAAGFLRVLRTLRLLRTYRVLGRLRADFRFFRRHEEVILATANLAVFIFIMTGIVYETQHYNNSQIANYADALYFTVTALTTTGFGDIVLKGTLGRFISVAVMIFGVTLFFNLARAVLQPAKVRHPCPTCGLQHHDYDAVHCKACGTTLNIPNDGRF